MIEVRNLTKKYGHRVAIDALNFDVKKGEIVGFLGPNGAGKTTTMKIITGFMSPTSGSVRVGGFDVFENPIEVKRKIGYLPEISPIYGDMYVKEYLKYVCALKQVPYQKRFDLVNSVLKRTNLQDVKNRLIQNLSKGYKQRVGLAQAILVKPEVLILDEPTVGLDPRQISEIRSFIQSLKGKHTLIISTHILSEVQITCEKIIMLSKGKIIADDQLSHLIENSYRYMGDVAHQKINLKVRKNFKKLLSSIKTLDHVIDVKEFKGDFKEPDQGQVIEVKAQPGDEVIEDIAQHVVTQGGGLLELKSSNLDLEDLFIHLTSSSSP